MHWLVLLNRHWRFHLYGTALYINNLLQSLLINSSQTVVAGLWEHNLDSTFDEPPRAKTLDAGEKTRDRHHAERLREPPLMSALHAEREEVIEWQGLLSAACPLKLEREREGEGEAKKKREKGCWGSFGHCSIPAVLWGMLICLHAAPTITTHSHQQPPSSAHPSVLHNSSGWCVYHTLPPSVSVLFAKSPKQKTERETFTSLLSTYSYNDERSPA